jgi:hypothetical protein
MAQGIWCMLHDAGWSICTMQMATCTWLPKTLNLFRNKKIIPCRIPSEMTAKLSKFVSMDQGPVKIFTFRDVPRLRYIAEVILGEILGLSWEIVTDKRKLGKNPVINYSQDNINGSFSIIPESLLFETGVRKTDLSVTDWKGLPVFFQTPAGSDLPFDIFAASFFLISRYEEYLEFDPDKYGRFRASSSFAFRNGFLTRPVIDLWAKEMAKTMILKLRNLVFKRSTFRSLVTIDVDQPFEFLGKDVFRSLGGLIRDISRQSGKVGERYRTVAKGEKDPFDVFDYITDQIEKSGTDARFFIPVGDRSDFDKQPSWQNEDYRKLILKISTKFKTGLHPTYYASGDASKLANEINRLKSILSGNISASRYHYVRIRIPESFKIIDGLGISEEYSMGYADEPGFRAGIARPYLFYDVKEERKTNLRIIPFHVMDCTLYQYKGLDPGKAKELISGLINETRIAGGLFVSIWHNTSLINNSDWIGWRDVFEYMLKQQQ